MPTLLVHNFYIYFVHEWYIKLPRCSGIKVLDIKIAIEFQLMNYSKHHKKISQDSDRVRYVVQSKFPKKHFFLFGLWSRAILMLKNFFFCNFYAAIIKIVTKKKSLFLTQTTAYNLLQLANLHFKSKSLNTRIPSFSPTTVNIQYLDTIMYLIDYLLTKREIIKLIVSMSYLLRLKICKTTQFGLIKLT